MAILFDLETTGLLPDNRNESNFKNFPRIIEFYGLEIDANMEIIREEGFLCNPGFDIPKVIRKITGIRNIDVKDKPPFADHVPMIQGWFTSKKRVVAHNLSFDWAVLKNEMEYHNDTALFTPKELICTVEHAMPITGYRLNLAALHKELMGEDFKDHHRAKEDVYALLRCYRIMMEKGYVEPESEV